MQTVQKRPVNPLPFERKQLFIVKKNKHNHEDEMEEANKGIFLQMDQVIRDFKSFQSGFKKEQKLVKQKLKKSSEKMEVSNVEMAKVFKKIKAKEDEIENMIKKKFQIASSQKEDFKQKINPRFMDLKESLKKK